MKCSLGISNFLEEISSLSHSIVSLYFFALITEEEFLISSSVIPFSSCLQSFQEEKQKAKEKRKDIPI